jgi:DNA-binding phage protein
MKMQPSISHDTAMIKELRTNPEFAAEYLKAAEDSEESAVLAIAESRVAKAQKGASPSTGGPRKR